MAFCDSNFNFTFVDIGAYGKEADSTVFRDSKFYSAMANSQLGLPGPRSIKGFESEKLPYVIVGDEAFGLSNHIMRPYGRNALTTKKKIFNYKLSRARRYVECSFGILGNKWRIFHRPLNVDISPAEDIVKAACVLHNYVGSKDGCEFNDTLTIEGVTPLRHSHAMSSRGSRDALSIREKFADYFMTLEGSFPWQHSKV